MLCSIFLRSEVEAERSVGELDILVIKYVRKICESGRRAKGAIDAVEGGAEEVLLGRDEGESVAARSFGVEVCILRRFVCLSAPCCAKGR